MKTTHKYNPETFFQFFNFFNLSIFQSSNLPIFLILSIFQSTYATTLNFSDTASFNTTTLAAAVKAKSAESVFAEDSLSEKDRLSRAASDSKLRIYLNLGDEYLFGKNTFKTSLIFKILPLHVSDLGVETSLKDYAEIKTCTLSLTQTSPEMYYELDVDDWFSTYPEKQEELNCIKIAPTAYTAHKTVQSYLNFQIIHEITYTLDVTDVKTEITPITSAANPQTFQWQAYTNTAFASGVEVNDVPFWQFQLLRLYNTDEDNTDEKTIKAKLDWSTALNIYTKGIDQSLTLNIGEGSGYYIWRVRPIGNANEDDIANSDNYGAWSYYKDNISLYLDGSSDPENTFWFDDADKDINWIYSRAFSEGDENTNIKQYETKSYANGLLQIQQSQAINQTEGFIVASQTYYDYNGRAALNSMAVPLVKKNTFEYVKKFMLNSNGAIYSAADFADDDSYLSPSTVDSSSYFGYYSDNNLNKFVPSSQGYPFSMARFKNDGSGRPIEISGVGKTFVINGGHTQKMYYLKAGDKELIELFGDEAPNNSKVYKMVNIDQNGVKSIAYINQRGQTIASCLGVNGNNLLLDDIPSHKAASKEISQQMIGGYDDYQECGDDCFENNQSFDLDEATNVTFSYVLSPAQFSGSITGCFSCDYYITWTIIGDNDISYSFEKLIESEKCSEASENWDTTFTLALESGVWNINRKVEGNNVDPNSIVADENPYGSTYVTGVKAGIKESLEAEASTTIANLSEALSENGTTGLKTQLTVLNNKISLGTNAALAKINAAIYDAANSILDEINNSIVTSSLFDPSQLSSNKSEEKTAKKIAAYLTSFENNLEESLQAYIELYYEALEESYDENCLDYAQFSDTLSYSYSIGRHHFTLFYYNRAGQLVRTVAPLGVDKSSKSRDAHPTHTYETEYDYDFLGLLTRKKTTDGGEITYQYDEKKRLRFSQNDKQKNLGSYSYIKYDDLGRMIEAGESSFQADTREDFLNNSDFPSLGNNRIYTVYTDACPDLEADQTQENLRNRISYVYNDDEAFMAFSYDLHANVKTLYNYVPGLGLKTTEYEYDLITNAVTKVAFNAGNVDQFFTQYTYDANSRLLTVETSIDDKRYEQDAAYEYYKHGALKREEIGKDNLQGLDYLYTLQGWLKGINHASLSKTIDPGSDNASNSFAPDIWGTMLAYYGGDFYRSSSAFNADNSNTYFPNVKGKQLGNNLYNGTITSEISKLYKSTTTKDLTFQDTWGYGYRYDELYRLKECNTASISGTSFASSDNYKMKFAYDANGNITSLTRNGYYSSVKKTKHAMDVLTYNYTANTNKLDYVTDPTSDANYTVDIDNQIIGNYNYDELGNLTQDMESSISNIEWNVQNKPVKVTKTTGETLEFTYDAMGNKIAKVYTSATGEVTTTYYALDTKGGLLSIYEESSSTTAGVTTKTLMQKEAPIKAGKRIGNYIPSDNWLRKTTTNILSGDKSTQTNSLSSTSSYARTMGLKQYEITDHLGNVRVTISDIKLSDIQKTTLKPYNYRAELTSASNYYAYGQQMPGNTYSTSNSRYGFQGKEKINEWEGEAFALDFHARIYDSRLGRFLSRDPLAENFVDLSPYVAFNNNPVMFIDPDGRYTITFQYGFSVGIGLIPYNDNGGKGYNSFLTGAQAAIGIGVDSHGNVVLYVSAATVQGLNLGASSGASVGFSTGNVESLEGKSVNFGASLSGIGGVKDGGVEIQTDGNSFTGAQVAIPFSGPGAEIAAYRSEQTTDVLLKINTYDDFLQAKHVVELFKKAHDAYSEYNSLNIATRSAWHDAHEAYRKLQKTDIANDPDEWAYRWKDYKEKTARAERLDKRTKKAEAKANATAVVAKQGLDQLQSSLEIDPE